MSYVKFLLVLISLSGPLYAQATDAVVERSTADMVEDDLKYFIDDGADIFTAPVHWNGRDWLIFGAVAGATAAAFALDEQVREAALPHKPADRPLWVEAGDWYGRPQVGGILGGGLYVGGLLADDDATRTTGRLLLESIAYSGIITTLLKSLMGRARPYKNEGNTNFLWFKADNDYLSFPSGHSTVAFAVSSVLAARIDNPFATIGLYGLAFMTVVQRIVTDNHWLSDTILGASIGTAVGLAVVGYEDDREFKVTAGDVPYVAGYSPHVPLFGISMGL